MAMALGGLAYAWGPNINNLEIEPHQIAQADFALRLAKLHSRQATRLEQGLIAALAHRYAVPVPEDRQPLNEAMLWKPSPSITMISGGIPTTSGRCTALRSL